MTNSFTKSHTDDPFALATPPFSKKTQHKQKLLRTTFYYFLTSTLSLTPYRTENNKNTLHVT